VGTSDGQLQQQQQQLEQHALQYTEQIILEPLVASLEGVWREAVQPELAQDAVHASAASQAQVCA